ncbi:LOW QUALITY PROTEIN: glycerol 2-dehydrogenase (NADP+) [Geosmithia morbida]|uniref:Glycerol 2-dehydrogenase (NADP+) n=1 Tax=Geosmithia morbida TaxID=1094350 RepID=A0A9P4YPL1_9HYPO|nr:LOW QUALITY PROTEIN: glycerol 2-dehydrogenase (NADP+) [Geosmithia morbida]KAF4119291.1 LOW QUALITY PROTEIN: glycerol 2-dehydrogenase (NADP+) [Geosmithia morbida]
MSVPTEFTLNTGAKIPAVGLGTWQAAPGEVRVAVADAIKHGYRHIDAALQNTGNENEVGQGIRDSGVPREEIFLTSKLWNTYHDNVKEGLQKSLDALGVDYLDLYLIHWPVRLVPNGSSEFFPVNPDGTRAVDRSWNLADTWRQMEEVYNSGKVKAIGVSNWSIPYLEELSKTWTVVPAVNQVELHPYLPQHELRQYCADKGILLEAYSPLGSSGAPLMSDSEIQKIADAKGVSPATILISYHVNKGTVVLPKSVSEKRIASNREVVKLSGDELAVLDGLAAAGKAKRINTPPWGFDLGFADWYGPVKSN